MNLAKAAPKKTSKPKAEKKVAKAKTPKVKAPKVKAPKVKSVKKAKPAIYQQWNRIGITWRWGDEPIPIK